MECNNNKKTNKRLSLRRIEKYRELNKDFSLFNYIKFEFEINKVCTDIYFAVSELYWPTFICYNNHIFLKESFIEERFISMEIDGSNTEFWMNLLSVDMYFKNDEDGDEKAIALSKLLGSIWEKKLKIDFPDHDFIVEYFEDEDVGDFGLTFYQTKYKKD